MFELNTTHLNLPLPHPDNDLEDDVLRLAAALEAVDTAVHGVQQQTGGKADAAVTALELQALENSVQALETGKADAAGVTAALAGKADKATTLAGYGIGDAAKRLAAEVKTAAFTAVNGGVYACDTSAGAFTMQLPEAPQPGWTVTALDYAGTFDIGNLTVTRNGSNILGLAEDYVIDQRNRGRTLIYVNAARGWLVYA